MRKGILGRKAGMTQAFTQDGKVIPVTVVEVEPNVVTQIKTKDTDGYDAVQLGIVDKKSANAKKTDIGHAKKANTNPKRFYKELRDINIEDYTLGQELSASTFEVGEKVDVTGTSKGKGTEGVIKRHGQSEGPKTHGSRYHRRPGSMGTMRPMRVLKGKKLAGHMGCETVTIQNLEIVEVSDDDKYILVSGNIPGATGSLVLIRSAVKGGEKRDIKIVTFTDEEVTEEKAESDVVNVEPINEDVTKEAPVTEEVVEEPVEKENTEEATNEVSEETTEAAEEAQA